MELWVIWLVAALVFGAGEMHAQGFVLAPLALGALVAAGASLAGLGAALSVLVFLVVSIGVLRLLLPLALRHQRRPMTLRTGAAAMVGQRALVVVRIANDEGVGSVRIDGEIWTARSFDDGVWSAPARWSRWSRSLKAPVLGARSDGRAEIRRSRRASRGRRGKPRHGVAP